MLTTKGQLMEIFRVIELFYILIMTVVTCLYAIVKTHRTALKRVNFTVGKSYLN